MGIKYRDFESNEELLDQIDILIEAKAIFNLNSDMLFCQTYEIPKLSDEQHRALMWWTGVITDRQFEILDTCERRNE